LYCLGLHCLVSHQATANDDGFHAIVFDKDIAKESVVKAIAVNHKR